MAGSITRPRTRGASIAGLCVALGAPFVLPFVLGRAQPRITDVRQDGVIVLFEWTAALAILAIVVFWERLPLRSIGFCTPSWRDAGAFAVVLVAMFAALGAFSALTRASSSESSGATQVEIAAVPLALRVVLFLTAGFCEELLFRGYAIERLALFTGKLWLGGAVSVVLFTLAHIPRYGLTLALVQVGILATALSALYLWRRNLWLCAGMHAFIDFLGLVVAPAFAARGML